MLRLYDAAQTDWDRVAAFQVMRNAKEGADLDDCYRTMMRVDSPQDWYPAWNETGQRWGGRAQEALAKGFNQTARYAFFQASIYYRMAEFFLPPGAPEKNPTYLRCKECFEKAITVVPPLAQGVQVPYQGTTLPGYFYLPKERRAKDKVPAVLYLGGADDCKEELHFLGVKEMTERGLAVLTFDGPGKGETIRIKGLYTRPDFEVVSQAAYDYLETRPEVDAKRLAVLGISMGGYYGGRAAAGDRRVKACVLWGACYDVLEDLYDFFPLIQGQLHYVTGARDPEQGRKIISQFTLKDKARQISCPLLIIHGARDFIVSPAAAHKTYEQAAGPKKLEMFEGGDHVCMNFFSEVRNLVADWLAENLA